MLINGIAVSMDVAAEFVDPGRTMLPFRWAAQALGARVTWDEATQTVTMELYALKQFENAQNSGSLKGVRNFLGYTLEGDTRRYKRGCQRWWKVPGNAEKVRCDPLREGSQAGFRPERFAILAGGLLTFPHLRRPANTLVQGICDFDGQKGRGGDDRFPVCPPFKKSNGCSRSFFIYQPFCGQAGIDDHN
ncbi:MAG: copper amine oxidase N-terminal domain-containing protein [Bacillota bacterium]